VGARGIEHAERGAPEVSEDRDIVLPEAFVHRFDQLIQIGDELRMRTMASSFKGIPTFISSLTPEWSANRTLLSSA
jgi:hypothetical protein